MPAIHLQETLLTNPIKAVRAGGFYVVTIANLRQGLLVLYGMFPVIYELERRHKLTSA